MVLAGTNNYFVSNLSVCLNESFSQPVAKIIKHANHNFTKP